MPGSPRTFFLAVTLVAASAACAFAAADNPGNAASPHTGYSSGMTPGAGTASGTTDGTTDTGASSPGSSIAGSYGSPTPNSATGAGHQSDPGGARGRTAPK
jgi:hypothetical protein